jgi:hypothetical protein
MDDSSPSDRGNTIVATDVLRAQVLMTTYTVPTSCASLGIADIPGHRGIVELWLQPSRNHDKIRTDQVFDGNLCAF